MRKVIGGFAATALCVCAGCSSTPKGTGEVFTVRNQAAGFAETAEGLFLQGDYAKALDLYFKAYDLHASVDNLPGVVKTSVSIGRLYLLTGRTEAAHTALSAAFDRAVELGDQDLVLVSANGLAEYCLATDQNDLAAEYIAKGFELWKGGAESADLALLYHNYGILCKRTGKTAEAEEAFLKAAAINVKLMKHAQLASNRYMLASISLQRDNIEGAMGWLQQALASDKAAENSRGIASDLHAIASVFQRQGNHEKAFDHFQRAFTIYRSLGMLDESRRSLAQIVIEAEALGKDAEADQYRSILEELSAGE